MKRGPIYVFLGPSLKVEAAKQILPAHYLPPARQADILSLVKAKRPAVIALIDGEFGQSLSVWHKEILFALRDGVIVYGASSMGALRAAELAPFGMRGVGKIFENYRSGEIVADDEVALTYGPAELGYPSISLPMVNVRATLATALVAGQIGASDCEAACNILKKVYFADRTLNRIHEVLAGIGWDRAKVSKLFEERLVDQKSLDAIELLENVRQLSIEDTLPESSFSLNDSFVFDVLDEQDRMSNRGIRFRAIAKFIALHDKNFSDLKINSLNRVAALILAKVLEANPSSTQLADEQFRFRRRFGLEGESEFAAWLIANDLNISAFSELMMEEASVRRIHNWILSAQGQKEFTKPLLDHLRLMDGYKEWENKSFNSSEIIKELHPSGTAEFIHATTESLDDLMQSYLSRSDWSRGMAVDEWLEEAGLDGVTDFRHELIKTVTSQRLLNRFVIDLLTANTGSTEGEKRNVEGKCNGLSGSDRD